MEQEKFKCEKCEKEFLAEESLKQHNSAKHSGNIKENKEKKPTNKKKIRNWFIFILIFAGIFAIVYWGISGTINEGAYCANQSVTEMNIGSHQNLKNHIHQELEIIIDEQKQLIPSDIGIAPGIMRPIHTHDSSGEVHVEGPCVRDFTLGEFFDIWDREFSSERIFDKTTQNGTLKLFVNGQENTEFRSLVLRDDDKIRIEYESN